MFEYIKNTYKVPAEIGRRVVVDGAAGVIAEDRGHYIGVIFDNDKTGKVVNCHPTWEVEYGGMGAVRKVKMTRSKARYQEYKDSVYYEAGHTFAFFLGIKSISLYTTHPIPSSLAI